MARLALASPLGGAGILLLCLWLDGCGAVWRYKTSIGYYYILSTRSTIYLEYEGTLFVEWDIPLLCTVANKSSPNTTLRCPVPGTHKIKPVVRRSTFEDMERYLSIIANVHCFLWYVYLYQEAHDSSDPPSVSDKQDIITWIIDPENADSSELNYTATSPSAYSQVLSKQFWNLGQRPVVKSFFQRVEYASTAFPEQGLWKFKVPIATEDMIAHIYGKAITFQDCFIFDTPLVITYSQIYFKNGYNISVSSPAGSNIMVSWSECFPTSAVLVTDFGTFYTNDGFITSREIKFPPGMIDAALIHSVKEVAVFFDHFWILVGDVVYKVEDHKISRPGEDEGVPDSGIIGLQSRTWCPSEYPRLDSLSDIIMWTNNSVYLLTRNQWYIFLTNLTILKATLEFRPTDDISIVKACFDSLLNEIALLIECNGCASTRVLYLAAVDELTDIWVLRDFSLYTSIQGVMNTEVFYSVSTSMLLWDDDKVYYTYGGNKVNGYLKVSGTDEIFSAASEGSIIHQIVIDHDGNTIIKLKNNVIYFFKFEMTHAVKLAAWENEYKSFVFYWIIAGTMYMLTVDGHSINRQIYPLKTEVYSAVFTSQEVCPYISFQHSVQSNVYYLDKRQNMTFWTQIVFLENLGLSTEISIYKRNILNQKVDLHYEIARGICTKHHTVTFYDERDYSNFSDPINYYNAIANATGVMTIELKPSSSGKTCVSSKVFFHINVGCPSYRHLRIKRPSSCDAENFTFIVPRKYMRFTASEDLKVQYDMKTYGCPIDVYYGEPFRPEIMLYDADNFIAIVESEYALWEMNGRTDFYYNATMDEARCLRYAQNWNSMMNKVDYRSLSLEEIDEIWGPHNYQTCFRFARGHFRNMHEPYEILNHSGISSITWPQYYTGIYMFRLKILDPNFSFCDLSVSFAVRTYGILERTSSPTLIQLVNRKPLYSDPVLDQFNWLSQSDVNDTGNCEAYHTQGRSFHRASPSGLKVAGFSVLIVTLFLGVLVFSYFKYVTVFRTLSFVDPLLPLHPLQSRTTSADELKKEE